VRSDLEVVEGAFAAAGELASGVAIWFEPSCSGASPIRVQTDRMGLGWNCFERYQIPSISGNDVGGDDVDFVGLVIDEATMFGEHIVGAIMHVLGRFDLNPQDGNPVVYQEVIGCAVAIRFRHTEAQ